MKRLPEKTKKSSQTFTKTRFLLFTIFIITLFTLSYIKKSPNDQKNNFSHKYSKLSLENNTNDTNDTICIEFNTCEDECQCAIDNSNSPDQACRNDASFVNYIVFYYCTMGNLRPLAILLFISFFILLNYYLFLI